MQNARRNQVQVETAAGSTLNNDRSNDDASVLRPQVCEKMVRDCEAYSVRSDNREKLGQ